MSILNTLAEQLGSAVVPLRGHAVTLRALTDAQSEAVVRMFPPPKPGRMRPDPSGGSLAPEVPDESDPEYRAAVAAWNRLVMRLEIAVAMGEAKVEDGPEKLAAAAGKVANVLTEREVARVFIALRDIGEAEDAARQALVADMRAVNAEDVKEVAPLPAEYGTTLAALDLRVRERFGLAPWEPYPSRGWATLLRANERLRQQEEARR